MSRVSPRQTGWGGGGGSRASSQTNWVGGAEGEKRKGVEREREEGLRGAGGRTKRVGGIRERERGGEVAKMEGKGEFTIE